MTVGIDYLFCLEPTETLTAFDDGPSYDDIYTVSITDKVVGDTPAGASRAFEFDQISSGTHPVDVFCKLDGTQGGCGFQIKLQGASQPPDGSKGTSQIVIQQGGTHSNALEFPTMKTVLEDCHHEQGNKSGWLAGGSERAQLQAITLYNDVSIAQDSVSSWGPWVEFEAPAAGPAGGLPASLGSATPPDYRPVEAPFQELAIIGFAVAADYDGNGTALRLDSDGLSGATDGVRPPP